uniref:HAT C-terminal dimerisation domain-containing protein n=1 Tax=Rhizophagus irregularis (strain DAOM 181602 / DAOM 197198 / MUCL 43194) TaxID=747089 RepID=U9SKH6_RHIID
MNIKGGVIVLYCKTRWTTAYKSIDDVLRVKAVLENMAANHSDLLTNDKIKPIICSWNFFNELKVLGFVLNPLCKAVLALERREADLSDCYLELARISLAIKKLPRQFYSEFPQKLGMDLAKARTFCSHLLKYKNKESPFDQPYTEGIDNPIKWWSSIELEPPYLQQLAIHLFSVCPNSASCERGFSICGWLSNKRRLKLGVERLESMLKLITYYRSNASHELAFYGKGIKKNSQKFSDSELNNIINETLAERPELEEDDDETMLEENQGVQRTTDGHIIPNHKVMVWIENTLDLFNPRILSGLENFGEFPEEEEDEINGNVNGNNQDDNEVVGRGILNFNVDDLAEEFEN